MREERLIRLRKGATIEAVDWVPGVGFFTFDHRNSTNEPQDMKHSYGRENRFGAYMTTYHPFALMLLALGAAAYAYFR